MRIILNRTELEKIVKDNIETPRGYEITDVSIGIDMDTLDPEDITAEIELEKEQTF